MFSLNSNASDALLRCQHLNHFEVETNVKCENDQNIENYNEVRQKLEKKLSLFLKNKKISADQLRDPKFKIEVML